MDDIVERLRGNNQRAYFGDGAIMYDAANEIERLRAALTGLLNGVVNNIPVDRFELELIREARAALAKAGGRDE